MRLFFTAYAFFSVGIGLILPTWQNYLVNIYSEEKIISGHSVMWIFQSIGKFLSGFVILKIITKYSFSAEGASIIFSLVGLLFIAGSLMFLITKEFPPQLLTETSSEDTTSKRRKFTEDLHKALHNRNFLFFLASDLEQFALMSIFSFYANYATEYCGIKPYIAAGIFVILSYSGTITINILFGWMGLLSLKNKYLAAKFMSLSAALLLFFFTSLWAFLAASFLIGISRGTRSLIYVPSINKISGVKDSTNFFGIAPILVMPLSTGLPLLTGAFLDHFAYLGPQSYRIVFLSMSALIAVGIFFLSKASITGSGYQA